MNAEYLLDAIGLLDDDLIAQAEEPIPARVLPLYPWVKQLSALASCLVIVIALGWGISQFRTGVGANSTSNGGAATSSSTGNMWQGGAYGSMGGSDAAPWDGALDGDSSLAGSTEPQEPGSSVQSGASGEPASSEEKLPLTGTILVTAQDGSGGSYHLLALVEKLPEGAHLVGELSQDCDDALSPFTDVEEYVGLRLWAENDGSGLPPAVYVELPGGGYARADLVQP